MTVASDSVLQYTGGHRHPVRSFAGFAKHQVAGGKLVDAGYVVRVAQLEPKGPALRKGDLVRVLTKEIQQRRWQSGKRTGLEMRVEAVGSGVKLLRRKGGAKRSPAVPAPLLL